MSPSRISNSSPLTELQNALAKHGAEIVGDIPNYTKIEPTVAHFTAFLGQRERSTLAV
jgi:hypothetical protein